MNELSSFQKLALVTIGFLVLVSVGLIAVAGGYYFGTKNTPEIDYQVLPPIQSVVPTPSLIASPSATASVSASPVDEGVACTMDAKLCPDGSSVGRTGPNCEFAPCPGE